MTHDIHIAGAVEVTALIDADFPEAPLTEAFPDIPAEDLVAATARFPGIATDDGHWHLRVRGWLVRSGRSLLLLDTGIGGPTAPSAAWAPASGVMPAALGEVGVAPGDIETVVLSHVHDDHIGGTLDASGGPLFPNARHVLQRADYEWTKELAGASEEDAVFLGLLSPLADAGLLDLIDGDHELTGELRLQHLPGHTPGHQVLRIASGEDRAVLSADTWNHPAQIGRPDWPSGPDNDHPQAAASRRALLAAVLGQPGTVIAPTHFVESFGVVVDGPDGVASWSGIG
jgi:glyoxylase-like metal-dependent hydrolase (beta-lactamase superfamily II)